MLRDLPAWLGSMILRLRGHRSGDDSWVAATTEADETMEMIEGLSHR